MTEQFINKIIETAKEEGIVQAVHEITEQTSSRDDVERIASEVIDIIVEQDGVSDEGKRSLILSHPVPRSEVLDSRLSHEEQSRLLDREALLARLALAKRQKLRKRFTQR